MGAGQAKKQNAPPVVAAQPKPAPPTGAPQQQPPLAGPAQKPGTKPTPAVATNNSQPKQQTQLTAPNAAQMAGTVRDDEEEGEEDIDGEMGMTADQISKRNTFIGNTKRESAPNSKPITPLPGSQNAAVLKSDQGAIVNRFKDSIDPAASQINPVSQQQVQTVLDSYQQQMKEFKNTVRDINNKFGAGTDNTRGGPQSQYTQQEEEEYQRTMGMGDQISTFRTEMMSKGMESAGPFRQQQIQSIQQQSAQKPASILQQSANNAGRMSPTQMSVQMSQSPTGAMMSEQQRMSIQTAAFKDGGSMKAPGVFGGNSLAAAHAGASIDYQQSAMAESQRSAAMDMAPYTSTFPDFRQDSRASFNVDFRQDTKGFSQANQQPGYSAGGYSGQTAQFTQQQSLGGPGGGGSINNFRQDSKPSGGLQQQLASQTCLPADINANHKDQQPSFQDQRSNRDTFQGPPPAGSIYNQSQMAENRHDVPLNTMQQILGQSQRTTAQQEYPPRQSQYSQQQFLQSQMNMKESTQPGGLSQDSRYVDENPYAVPQQRKEMPMRLPVPRDQLLTQEQKNMLVLGQRDSNMERKLDQPLLTQLIQRDHRDDDELGHSGGYYNFDSAYTKPESLIVGGGGKLKPVVAQVTGQTQQTRQPEPDQQPKTAKPAPQAKQEQSSAQQEYNRTLDQSTAPSIMASQKNITMDELAYLKEQFVESEERERLNPQNVLIRVLFIHAFNSQTDEEQAAHEEATTERRLYSFIINKTGKIIDLKDRLIKKEFGFDIEQQKIYYRYKELNNQQFIMDIEQFDIEEDILTCVTINGPKTHIPAILRDPLDDIKMADVRLLNSRERTIDKSGDIPENLDKFDVDQDKLPWPAYRDWTAEAAYLSGIIVKNKTVLLSDESQFLMQQGITRQLHQSPDLAELTEAEAAYRKLCEDFRRASLYSVHLTVKKNPTPLNLFNLYGDDGDKYVVGGILIRRAKDWTICGQPFTESSQMHTTAIGPGGGGDSVSSNLTEISGKIASLDVRNLALLRNRIQRLVVPLACLVDYYGLKFECQSLAPLSINSLVYGSDTNGLTFTNKDLHAEGMAKQISYLLNLKTHYIEEQATGKIKQVHLPYTVQLHRNKDLQDDLNLYLVNPFRLFAQDESLRQQQANQVPFQDIMSKQLRPELIVQNNKGEPDQECQYFTWKQPTKCDECGQCINDYEYYFFEKKSVEKSQRVLIQYYCCVNCFMERLPTESFKHPVNKIRKKELTQKERLQYYQNTTTGHKFMTMQFSRVPLNPDAYFHLSGGKDKADKISEQEEILRAAQKLKDEVIGKLIEDLNNVEEDPLTGEALERVFHVRGINMRHIGRICTVAELNHVRELCVIEVIARSAKLLIKDGLTFLADDEEAGFQASNIKKCVLHYLLEIFNIEEAQGVQPPSVQNIWDFITEHARKKFQVTIERDVLSKINMTGLLLSLTQKLNIRLRKPVKDIDFFSLDPSTGMKNFLKLDDIDTIVPNVKDYIDRQPVLSVYNKEDVFPCSLTLVLESARIKDSQGKRSQWFMRGGEERQEATELYRLAASVCEQIYGNKSVRYARLLKEFGEHLESRHQEKGRPENSRWNKSFAIVEDDLSSESRFFYNSALQTFIDVRMDMCVEAAEINVALARLVKPRISQYAHYREQDSSVYDVFQYLMHAVDIYEIVLGFDHPETADAYTKMALAYQEQGNFAAASPWIRRAFTVFFKCFGPHDPITQSAYEQLKSIETNVDSKLDQVPFEDLPSVIFEIEKQQKLMADQSRQLALLNSHNVAIQRY